MSEKIRKAHPELILLFAIGFNTKMITGLGYSQQTAYKYKQHYENAKIEIVKRLMQYAKPV